MTSDEDKKINADNNDVDKVEDESKTNLLKNEPSVEDEKGRTSDDVMTSDEDKQVNIDTNDVDKVADDSETNLLENEPSAADEKDEATQSVPDLEPTNGESKQKQGKIGLRDIIRNIKHDCIYRQKFVHTCCLWWSFVGLGWIVGMNGPTFPDLRQIINEDLATSSWMFPAGSFGYLIGSFVGGILYDKFNKILLLAMSTLGLGISTIVTPFCAALPWMLFIKFAGGVFSGGLDVGGNSDIIFVWGQDGNSYMQALHFGFSLGAAISPYVTEPFLAKKIRSCPVSGNMTSDPSVRELFNSTKPNSSTSYNSILETDDHNATAESTIVTTCTEEYEASSVHIAFILAGLIILTSTIGYMYLYIQSRRNKLAMKARVAERKQSEAKTNRKKLTVCTKVSFLVLLGILFATYCIVEDGFASFLMTFAIERLKWDKSTGSFATGLFWWTFGIGRFMGIFIIAYCKTSVLLTSYLIMLGCGYVGFLLSSIYYVYPLIWVFIGVLGFSMSVIFPAIFSWTSENIIEVTGKISAFFLTTASLSGMFCLFLIGNLMDKYDAMWFVYVMVIIMAVCLISYGVLSVMSRRIHSHSQGDKNGTNSTVDRQDCTEMKLMQ